MASAYNDSNVQLGKLLSRLPVFDLMMASLE